MIDTKELITNSKIFFWQVFNLSNLITKSWNDVFFNFFIQISKYTWVACVRVTGFCAGACNNKGLGASVVLWICCWFRGFDVDTNVLEGIEQAREIEVIGEIQRGTVITLFAGFDDQLDDCCIGLGTLGAVVLGLDVLTLGTKLVPVVGAEDIPTGWRVTNDLPWFCLLVILETCTEPEK